MRTRAHRGKHRARATSSAAPECVASCSKYLRPGRVRQAALLSCMVLARVSRVLLAALVLLAGLATPDLVCAEHGQDATRPVQAERNGGAEHHEHGPAAPEDPCERPDLPPCCPVLMSCSFALSAGLGAEVPRDDDGSRMPLLRLSRIALSRITTPDPPPPRS